MIIRSNLGGVDVLYGGKMKNELKTLKDMEANELEDYVDKRRFFSEDRLRQEAIKWIKCQDKNIIRSEFNSKDCVYCHRRLDNPGNAEILHTREWIKYFFNISEKEIQDDADKN